ncbi:hypothetical protein CMQ_5856 [Grosmannia clavigera kw1407]|uniref:Glycoprotease family protein n=1 Tax=Grosmannia clavigera (strain kw1407 / UAMH 11150) TaxID=655863 RepID=F0XII4_GROCL|nr:uncharacterized protein CMQ_5856 [Grosmannia clavigera kw1407]EFX02495.1 hypothetical protein CMQ_5856 [Grosmannia clavigera kw1407]
MNDQTNRQNDPFETPFDGPDDKPTEQEDWEQWESDCDEEKRVEHNDNGEDISPLASSKAVTSPKTQDQVLPSISYSRQSHPLQAGPSTTTAPFFTQASTKNPVQNPLRLISRARQKDQNNKEGIRLVTDMSKFRKQQQAEQRRQPGVGGRVGKFVDAAALRALEGKPSDTSIGNWNWLRRMTNGNIAMSPQKHHGGNSKNKADNTPITTTAQGLSPNDGPIVIGISLPEDDLAGKTLTPQTTTMETPFDASQYLDRSGAIQPRQGGTTQQHRLQPGQAPTQGQVPSRAPQLQSVWSPDTEDGSPLSSGSSVAQTASSIYSMPNHNIEQEGLPPVPTVPPSYHGTSMEEPRLPFLANKSSHTTTRASIILRDEIDDDDDYGTPITLFEEDGSPRSYRRLSHVRSYVRSMAATVGTTHSGWWDHVRTPFAEHPASPFSGKTASPTTPASTPATEPVPAVPVVAEEFTVPVLPAITMTPAVSAASDEWWRHNDGEQPSPAAVEMATGRNKTGLGISTALANAGRVQVSNDRSPTVVSSSRFLAPIQPAGETSEKTVEVQVQGRERSTDTPSDAPPPYETPSRPEMAVRYRAVLPPGHLARADFPLSPGPISPGLLQAMTSQGAIHMAEVPLTPPGIRSAAAASGTPLPNQPRGAFLFRGAAPSPAAAKVERTRQRHEKEDVAVQQAGSFWRGRGCLPQNGCFGRRRGREARKRRRAILGVAGGVISAITLAVVLAVVLARRHTAVSTAYSFWLNTTDFPPIPTGVTTVVGAENTITADGCVSPSTMWSCSLPKEQQNANLPFSADALMFVLDIQFDNSSQKLWNVADGAVPVPTTTTALSGTTTSFTAKTTGTAAATTMATSTSQRFDAGFTPQPSPPAFEEMWFLGNTTDDIVADRKAGEPTPFYISFLASVNSSTAGPNEVVRRRNRMRERATGSSSSFHFPAAATNADGTGAAAVLRPFPKQQPVRLYDRGLPTEHYGFYSYFDKTIYVKSTAPDGSDADDKAGGSLETEAAYMVTFLQTRFLVEIWTRMGNSTRMLGDSTVRTANTTQPGTFPYPITITEDLHGGDFNSKGAFARAVDSEQHILAANTSLIVANLQFGGTLINHSDNLSFGGSDGGSGGCKCAWANFLGENGNTST